MGDSFLLLVTEEVAWQKWATLPNNNNNNNNNNNDGGNKSKHIGVGFVEISEIFVTQDAIFFGLEPFDRVDQVKYPCHLTS